MTWLTGLTVPRGVTRDVKGTAKYFFTRNGTEQERQFKKLSGTERNMLKK